MLCELCTKIHLDVFLPHRALGTYRNGRAWHNVLWLREGPDCLQELHASSDAGCHLCTIFRAALDGAEPFWALGEFNGRDHQQIIYRGPLRDRRPKPVEPGPLDLGIGCTVEGELRVTDGRRTGGLYWQLESLNYGKSHLTVRDRADDPENFALAATWLETCTQQHDKCKDGLDPNFLPTRLIDVGTQQSSRPRLVETGSGLVPFGTPYFALSHCWGTGIGKTILKTTKYNLPDHLAGIDPETLPKTFQDAVEVVQKLGYQYLWIDSLCIVQDDSNDFEIECSRMDRIYSQAHSTIVASDSPSSTNGFLLPRSPLQTQPVRMTLTNRHAPSYRRTSIMDVICERFENEPESAEVTIYPNFGPWINGLRHGPVFSRGWCLQERELSPRVLHFTANRLMWECRTCIASEEKPSLESKSDTNAKLANHLSSARVFDDDSLTTASRAAQGGVFVRNKWEAVVEAYSQRSLSVATDRLPAISGIAKAFSARLPVGEEYLAGIWKGSLMKGISWIPKRTREPEGVAPNLWPPRHADRGIPTWSWAAFDGPIAFVGESWYGGGWTAITDSEGKEQWIKTFGDAEIHTSSVVHVGADPFGRVSGGVIEITGWTLEMNLSEPLLLSPKDEQEKQKAIKNGFYSKCYGRPTVEKPAVVVYFDHDPAHLPPSTRVVCLQLGTGKSPRGSSPKTEVGLALVPNPSGDESFLRVGMFDVVDRPVWQGAREKRRVRLA